MYVCTSKHSYLKCVHVCRGFRSLQNLVAISQRYYRCLLTLKAGCKGYKDENWLLSPGLVAKVEATVANG